MTRLVKELPPVNPMPVLLATSFSENLSESFLNTLWMTRKIPVGEYRRRKRNRYLGGYRK